MATARILRGMFPVPKPHPMPAMGSWVGFEVQADATLDLAAMEVRGYQGPIRAVPADPRLPGFRDWSEPFVVHLTAGDVAAIKGVLDARLAALGVQPRPVYSVALAGASEIGVAWDPVQLVPTEQDIDAILGVVLMRAKAEDTMGVYRDPAWPVGSEITMTVNGQAV